MAGSERHPLPRPGDHPSVRRRAARRDAASRSRRAPVTWLVPRRRGRAATATARDDVAGWRLAFDQVADELRAALGWAAGQGDRRAQAYRLALGLADLCFARGLPGESQRRYEQAAALAGPTRCRGGALRRAAGAAETRHFGTDALRLHRAAAERRPRRGPGRRGDDPGPERRADQPRARPDGLPARCRRGGGAAAPGWALAGDDHGRRPACWRPRRSRARSSIRPLPSSSSEPSPWPAGRRPADRERRARPADRHPAGSRRDARGGRQRAAPGRAAGVHPGHGRGPGWRSADTFSMGADCAIAAGDLPAARRLAAKGSGPALPPRGGPPGHVQAAGRARPDRRLGRGGRAGRAVPRGLGAGRPPACRQPEPGAVRGRHRPRPAR